MPQLSKYVLTCVFSLALLPSLPASAQGAVSALDINSRCLITSIPNAEKLSVSWTGACVAGLASGLGDVIAFSNGKLRYILRGQFKGGHLEQQEHVRDCAGDACLNDVPPNLIRQHAAAALAASVTTPVATAIAAGGPAPQAEIRAPDAVYRGRFTTDPVTGVISGEGRVQFLDGRAYEGTIKNGRKVGKGTHVWADGQRYEGDWVDDQQQGKGKLTFSNGDSYDGNFVKGERTGEGTFRQKSGDSYTGQWVNGLREGNGVAVWANGQRYEGAWRGDHREGQGVMKFPDGGTYDGEWKNDQPSGQGDIQFASGDAYTGQVRNGIPNGQGIFRWGSGDRFDGEFDNGKPTAKGEMTFLLESAAKEVAAADPAPTPPPAAPPVAATTAAGESSPPAAVVPPSRASLCSAAFNHAGGNPVSLKRFIDSFPDDECQRHAMAKQKLAKIAEAARVASLAADERIAMAKSLIGGTVTFQQPFPFCVIGTGATCQSVNYIFYVKAKIRDIDPQKRIAQVQIFEATSLGNEKGASGALFSQGRVAATGAFNARFIGTTQSKTLEQVGLAF
ncbi:MAG: hypothetical protein ABIZ64_01295 [Casimicrobium sp.]|jgi:hypothetical protein